MRLFRMEKDRSLQALRGWAALVVLLAHALLYVSPGTDWTLWLNQRGAVAVFFVLSGFVLAQSARQPIDFYVRRLLRFFPALWVATLLGCFYLAFVHPNVTASTWLMERFPVERWSAAHIALAFAGLPFVLPQSWTICVELVASAVSPAFKRLAGMRSAYWIALAGLAAMSYLIPNLIALYLVSFLAGAGLSSAPKVPALVPLLALAVTAYLPWGYFDPTTNLIETALAVLVVRNWRWSFGEWLGDRSYGLYLYHFPVMCLAGPFVPGWSLPLVTVALTIPLAALSWSRIERPALRAAPAVVSWVRWRSGRGPAAVRAGR